MSYYSGAMGDYKTYGYAGDPGFLSSLWKGFKKVARFIPGPIGTIARVAGAAGVGAAAVKMLPPPQFPTPSKPMPMGFMPGRGTPGGVISGREIRTADTSGYVPGFPAGPTRGSVGMVNGACPCGYHPEKSGKGYCVRNRRMNIANPRALRRGMRRVQGFEKLARRTISFTRRVKMKKRGST